MGKGWLVNSEIFQIWTSDWIIIDLISAVKMLQGFQFSPSHSLFFLWLNEQDEPLPSFALPASELSVKKIENSPLVVPPTSSSEAEDPPEILLPANPLPAPKHSFQGQLNQRVPEPCLERDYRDPCFNPKKQKKNRNVLSNLVHHLLKYLSGREVVDDEIGRIVAHHQLSITPNNFYQMLEDYDQKLKSYVTEKNFKSILVGSADSSPAYTSEMVRQFATVMRVLSYKFYREGCISSIVHSNKLSYQSKNLHFQGLKDILHIIQSLLEPEIVPPPKAKGKKSR